MRPPLLLLTLSLLTALSSCVAVKTPVYTAKPGIVKEVTTERTYNEPSEAITAGAALRGGLIGAVISRGASGHIIGAAAGAIIGGLIAHTAQEADAEHIHRYTLVKLDTGELCEFSEKAGPRVRRGSRVYVLFNEKRLPIGYQKISDD